MSYAGEGVALDDQRVWDGTKWVLAKRPLTQAQTLSATGSWDGLADYILVTGTGARVITLPKPTLVPRNVTVIDAAGNSSTNLITVVAAGGGTIGGQSSVLLNVDHSVIDLAFVSTVGAGSWSNISRNLAARRVYGRADGAGTGATQELTGAQLGSIIRSNTFTSDTTSAGTIATYALTSAQNAVKFSSGITSPTIHGATTPAEPGQVIFWHVDSTVTGVVTFANESGTAGAAPERFRTPSGAALVLGAGESAVSCYFDSRHHIIATSGMVGKVVTVNAAGGTQNDLALGTTDQLQVAASTTITGFAGGYAGRHLYLTSVGVRTTLAAESVSSTATNRITGSSRGEIVVEPGDSVDILYTGTRWVVVSREDLDSTRYTELIDHFNTYFEVGANVLLGDTPWLISSNDGQHDTAPSGASGTAAWGRFELRNDSAASINDYAVLCKGAALGFASLPYGWQTIRRVRFLGSITNATNGRLVFGIGDYLGDINFSALNRSIIITGSSGSANWRFVHFNAGGGTADQDTGVTFDTTVRLFEIVRVGDISTGSWQCWIDGVLRSTITVDVPNQPVNFGVLVQSLAASQRVAMIDMLSIRSGTLTGAFAA